MKIMSIISRIASKSIVVPVISFRITRKRIALPPVDEQRIVELHPELIRFFDRDDQVHIAFMLWYKDKLNREQAVELCPEVEADIESYEAYCKAMQDEYEANISQMQ